MYKKLFLALSATAVLFAGGIAIAADPAVDAAKVKAVYDEKIKVWVNDPVVIAAVKAQNEKNAALAQADIDGLDGKWKVDYASVIDPVLNNDLSKYLQGVVTNGAGLYSEIIVVDNKGLNVGQSAKTSDYWQGDEAKFTETFPKGKDALHTGEVEMDESSQTFQVQISATVSDGDTPIGAVTVGLNAEAVQ